MSVHIHLKPGAQPLSDGEHKAFRGWGTQEQLSLRDMSLSDDKITWKGVLKEFLFLGTCPYVTLKF